jgi:hypothetical protein|tara:strand:- start:1350 stop:1469 length:120 start_codon:yes stop_codon:yes gene_type:complete
MVGPVELLKAGKKDDLFAASQKLLEQATSLEQMNKQEAA